MASQAFVAMQGIANSEVLSQKPVVAAPQPSLRGSSAGKMPSPSSVWPLEVAAAAAVVAGATSLRRGARRPQHSKAKTHVQRAASQLPGGRPLRVAVVGGGPSGASAADTLAKSGIETYLIERKLDNCKPCGGAIPLCMMEEFDLPMSIVDRKVKKMTMISPSNKEVQIGATLKDEEYIGMVRREILDSFLRERARSNGATIINGLCTGLEKPEQEEGSYTVTYNDFGHESGKARKGVKASLEVDVVIGADGANSRVAKEIDAGDYEYAIAFQERMKIPEEKMEYYKDRAEMYVGEDVSPDFYAWVFPKCDHVAVGTGTVKDKKHVSKYQQGIRERAAARIEGGEILRVEAHPIPEHYRPRRLQNRAVLVGDAAGYVTKCAGEGIYFAAKSGRMCAEKVVAASQAGRVMISQADLQQHLDEYDAQYGPTYFVLDMLQKLFYTNDPARESFVELCDLKYVQQVTFDSYLYKKVQGNNPALDVALLGQTMMSLAKNNLQEPQPMRALA